MAQALAYGMGQKYTPFEFIGCGIGEFKSSDFQ